MHVCMYVGMCAYMHGVVVKQPGLNLSMCLCMYVCVCVFQRGWRAGGLPACLPGLTAPSKFGHLRVSNNHNNNLKKKSSHVFRQPAVCARAAPSALPLLPLPNYHFRPVFARDIHTGRIFFFGLLAGCCFRLQRRGGKGQDLVKRSCICVCMYTLLYVPSSLFSLVAWQPNM